MLTTIPLPLPPKPKINKFFELISPNISSSSSSSSDGKGNGWGEDEGNVGGGGVISEEKTLTIGGASIDLENSQADFERGSFWAIARSISVLVALYPIARDCSLKASPSRACRYSPDRIATALFPWAVDWFHPRITTQTAINTPVRGDKEPTKHAIPIPPITKNWVPPLSKASLASVMLVSFIPFL